MTIVPSVSDFASDFFYAKYDEKKTLVICSLDEEFQTQSRNVVVKRCLILVAEEDDDGNVTQIPCSSVIGIGNSYISLKSDYPELEGKLLTIENIEKCYIETK